MNLEEFLEERLNDFEQMASKKKDLPQELLNFAKNKVANGLYFIALFHYPGKQKEIENYLKQKGYNFNLGKEIENVERALKKAGLEQNPETN